MRFLPVNLDALLIELDDLPQTMALHASLGAHPPEGVRELVCGARTLLVKFDPTRTDAQALVNDVARRRLDQALPRHGAPVEIPVHYNGEDIDDLARLLGLTRAALIARHTQTEWRAAFCGFAPGFAYLHGGDANLTVPRRASPRTRVPRGAVALAGGFSAVYPQESPGGWQLIGTTPLTMWDTARNPPALVQPGDRVRFIDAATLAPVHISALCAVGTRDTTSAAPAAPDTSTINLHVQSSGLCTLFQDAGRHGLTALGVGISGAADRAALRAANRLVGNAPDAVCLEVTQGGLVLTADGNATLAVTGADVPITVCSAQGQRWGVARNQPFALGEGDTLSLGAARAGVRAYVAARGGFVVAPVLGSCASDTLARLGPPALVRGDTVHIRAQAPGQATGDALIVDDASTLPRPQDCVTLDVIMGPRTDWFTPDAIARLCTQTWRVTPQSDRIGLRLAGVAITRTPATLTLELPSEGVCAGAIQIPPDGQPVLCLADHPVTGGYPVIAAVVSTQLDLAGQIPVNSHIRFRARRAFAPILPTPVFSTSVFSSPFPDQAL